MSRPSPAEVARLVEGEMRERRPEFVALVEELVAIDSGHDSSDGIAKVEAILAGRLEATAGAVAEWRHEGGVDHVALTIPGDERRVALLGHADTVFAAGTASSRPMRIFGEHAVGPGVADMKGGLAMAVMVIEALVALHHRPTVELVVVGDEETRVVPPPFMDRLASAAACLVLECGRPGGGFITRRKGGLWIRLEAIGRPAHAGVEPERGTSAIVRLCRAVVAVAALHRQPPDLTVSIGRIGGGSAPNVVAGDAWAEVDVRAFAEDDLAGARHRIEAIAADLGVAAAPAGDWPPMETAEGAAVVDRYLAMGEALGLPFEAQATGGMSDGCWTADAGVPTVDGVGPEGGDDHSPDEFLDLASVPGRAGALAGAITATNQPGGRP